MSSPDLVDLAARLIAVLRALANGEDPLQGQLKSLLSIPDQLAKRVQDAVDAAGAAAKDQLEHLAAAAAEASATAAQALTDATTVFDDATHQIEQQLTRATASADQAKAAAQRGFDQAKAVGGAALDEAAATRDKAIGAAEQGLADAQKAATAAQQQAAALLQDVQQRATDAATAATKAAGDALATVQQLGEQARQAVTDAIGQAQQIPGQVTALADDTLRKIDSALAWPAGILSLVAKVLHWLHHEVLHDDPHVDVISYEPPSGTTGLGLRFTDGPMVVTVAFCPDHPTAKGSVVISATGNSAGPVVFGPPGARLTFTGLGDQTLLIGPGTPDPAPGKDAVTLSLELGAAQWNGKLGPLSADVAAPVLAVALHHDTKWHYAASAKLPKYGVALNPSDLLAAAGIPIPLAVPSIDEHRALTLEVDDGDVAVHEGAAA